MSTYKIVYHDAKGLAEPLRAMFVYSGIEYENELIPNSQWAIRKKEFPNLQLPILFENGQVLTQSRSMYRYIGGKLGLVPNDPWLAYRCDQFVETFEDQRKEFVPYFRAHLYQGKAEMDQIKKPLIESIFPRYFKFYETIIVNGGPWIAGDQLSYADFVLASFMDVFEQTILPSNYFENYPILNAIKHNFFAIPQLKSYLEQRPVTFG